MARWVRVGVVGVVVVAVMVGGARGAVAGVEGRGCERGEMCLWGREGYRGVVERVSLETVNPGECVALPGEFVARSFVNRMKRMVTVYQSRECATEGEFDTYPGGGTYVPEAPYLVRALQIWDGQVA